MKLNKVIADVIYWDVDTDPIPDTEECKTLIEDKLTELKTLQSKLGSLPFDFCDGSLLMAAIEDSIESIDWNVVVEEIRQLRLENKD